MPCNSDYLESNFREKNLSAVRCFLDEINGQPWEKSWLQGYHPRVYNQCVPKATADHWVRTLCAWLQRHPATDYSLELQIWWRDHQTADSERLRNEFTGTATATATIKTSI